MSLLIGVDLGTTGLKVVAVDLHGNNLASAESSYFYDVPLPGYAEQDPEVWWKAAVQAVRIVAGQINKDEIKGISFSGQMHGLVSLDRNGDIVRKAILHCDQRAHRQCDYVNDLFPDSGFYKITYNPPFSGFLLFSLKWIKDNEPENFKKICYAICPKDYLRYRMCGEIGVEVTDASATLAYDAVKGNWSKQLADTLELDFSVFPTNINQPSDEAGKLSKVASSELNLPSGIPVYYGGGDQPMQLLGAGAVEINQMTVTLGSSGQVSVITDKPVLNPKFNSHTFRAAIADRWFSMGGILSAGAAMNWFRRTFLPEKSYQDVNDLAAAAPCCSEGLVFFPCLAGERTPYIDSFTRGMFFGMSYYHDISHFARAVIEGVCFQAKTSIDLLNSLGCGGDRIIASGGAAKSEIWLQIQADIYGKELIITGSEEQSALGAAITAGVGSGVFASFSEACSRMVKYQSRIVKPNLENNKKIQRLL